MCLTHTPSKINNHITLRFYVRPSVWRQVVVLQNLHSAPTRGLTLRHIYLSCFRGSVFRLNIGLAEGEERGLMGDRREKRTTDTEKENFRDT